MCHYAPVAVPALPARGAAERRAGATAAIDEATIEHIVLDARATVLRTLTELTSQERAKMLARTLLARGDVVAVRDALGGLAHAPVDRRRMRLAERVVSVFVADWLNDRLAYRIVRHCGACGDVSFGEPLAHDPSCTDAPGRHTVMALGELTRASA